MVSRRERPPIHIRLSHHLRLSINTSRVFHLTLSSRLVDNHSVTFSPLSELRVGSHTSAHRPDRRFLHRLTIRTRIRHTIRRPLAKRRDRYPHRPIKQLRRLTQSNRYLRGHMMIRCHQRKRRHPKRRCLHRTIRVLLWTRPRTAEHPDGSRDPGLSPGTDFVVASDLLGKSEQLTGGGQ
jgi:hypothetical protein